MGCPTTPLSCLDPVNIFAGVYNPRCGGFADPSNFQAEQAIFGSSFQELINNYGVEINYYVNNFDIRKMNGLYGEHPTQTYSDPTPIKAYIELEEAFSLSQFGMSSDDELTCYIAIKDFLNKFTQFFITEDEQFYFISENNETFSNNYDFTPIEPKSDDLIEITALGCDRPRDRGSKIFRITEAKDQSVKDGINPAMGHYIWKITAKRYETSHETNAPMEAGNNQVYDNKFSGKSESTLFPLLSTEPKLYDYDVDDVSKNQVYNMDNTNNNIYGNYY